MNRDKGEIMSVDMQWATKDEVQELAVGLARLETKVGESDKRLATKEDVAAVLIEVSRLETKTVRLLLSIGVPLLVGMVALLYRLFIP